VKWPAYPSYTKCGIEWLGMVPEGWTIDRLKWTVEGCFNGIWGDDPDGKSDIVCIRVADFDRTRNRVVDGEYTYRAIADNLRNSRLLKNGDLLIEKSGGGEGQLVGVVVLFDKNFPAVCSNFVARMPVRRGFAPSFLTYLHDAIYATRLNVCSIKQNTGIQNLDSSAYLDERAAYPLEAEQVSISSFLDRETAKLDTLIAKQERLIELLQEKRQAVISRAVTKGLDPTAPMKESGVEWLGQVPAHWEVRRIASVSTKITNGFVGPTRDILVEQGVTYLQSLHIKENRIVFDGQYFVAPQWSLEHSKSILKAGDVLIVQTGDIGQVAVVTPEHEGANCHALIIVSPVAKMLSGRFLAWLLNSDYGLQSLKAIQTGALHPHLNCGNVKDVKVPLPPIGEQQRIAEFVDRTLGEFSRLIEKSQRSIDLMREHRTALISAAVTGKIDVREAA